MITKRLKMHWYVQDYSEKKFWQTATWLVDAKLIVRRNTFYLSCMNLMWCTMFAAAAILARVKVVSSPCCCMEGGGMVPATSPSSVTLPALWCSGPGLRLTHFTKQSENKCKNSHASCLFLRLDMNESQRRTRSGQAESFIRVNRS